MTKKIVEVTEKHRIRIIEHKVVGKLYYEVRAEYRMFHTFWVNHDWTGWYGMLKVFTSYDEAEQMSEVIRHMFLDKKGYTVIMDIAWFGVVSMAVYLAVMYFKLY